MSAAERAWYAHNKNVFILTSSGKPVWLRFDGPSSVVLATCSVLTSLTDHTLCATQDPIKFVFTARAAARVRCLRVLGGTRVWSCCLPECRCIRTRDMVFVFVQHEHFYMMASARTGESMPSLGAMLRSCYKCLIFNFSSSIHKELASRPSLDLRPRCASLTPTLRYIVSLSNTTLHTVLQSISVLHLSPVARNRATGILTSACARCPQLLYAMLFTGASVAAWAQLRNKEYALHAEDAFQLMAHVQSNPQFRNSGVGRAGTSWLRCCLPALSPQAHVYVYVHYFGSVRPTTSSAPYGVSGDAIGAPAAVPFVHAARSSPARTSAPRLSPSTSPTPASAGAVGALTAPSMTATVAAVTITSSEAFTMRSVSGASGVSSSSAGSSSRAPSGGVPNRSPTHANIAHGSSRTHHETVDATVGIELSSNVSGSEDTTAATATDVRALRLEVGRETPGGSSGGELAASARTDPLTITPLTVADEAAGAGAGADADSDAVSDSGSEFEADEGEPSHVDGGRGGSRGHVADSTVAAPSLRRSSLLVKEAAAAAAARDAVIGSADTSPEGTPGMEAEVRAIERENSVEFVTPRRHTSIASDEADVTRILDSSAVSLASQQRRRVEPDGEDDAGSIVLQDAGDEEREASPAAGASHTRPISELAAALAAANVKHGYAGSVSASAGSTEPRVLDVTTPRDALSPTAVLKSLSPPATHHFATASGASDALGQGAVRAASDSPSATSARVHGGNGGGAACAASAGDGGRSASSESSASALSAAVRGGEVAAPPSPAEPGMFLVLVSTDDSPAVKAAIEQRAALVVKQLHDSSCAVLMMRSFAAAGPTGIGSFSVSDFKIFGLEHCVYMWKPWRQYTMSRYPASMTQHTQRKALLRAYGHVVERLTTTSPQPRYSISTYYGMPGVAHMCGLHTTDGILLALFVDAPAETLAAHLERLAKQLKKEQSRLLISAPGVLS